MRQDAASNSGSPAVKVRAAETQEIADAAPVAVIIRTVVAVVVRAPEAVVGWIQVGRSREAHPTDAGGAWWWSLVSAIFARGSSASPSAPVAQGIERRFPNSKWLLESESRKRRKTSGF